MLFDSQSAAGPAWSVIRCRLLGQPSLSPAEVLARGHDPALPDLIRLPTEDGSVRLPAFQFDRRGVRRVVLAVNRRLDAAGDPWGVADWWLQPNAWLGACPADLPDSADLLAAADADG